MADYHPRIIDQQLREALQALGAVAVEGPKACGKTETARQQARSEVLFDVDANARAAVDLDPRLPLRGETPRLLDEWQRAPQVWDAVRRAVDDRRQKGQFILTGSATPNDVIPRHSGAGRMAVLQMRTMSLLELSRSSGEISLAALLTGQGQQSSQTDHQLSNYVADIVQGGWPDLIGASAMETTRFLRGYLDTIVEYDVSTVSGAHRDPEMLRRFMQSYAHVVAQPAQLQTIIRRARGADVDDDGGPSRWTAEPYLTALRRLMIVDELPAWRPALRSRTRLVGTPKRHLVDPSLVAELLGVDAERLLTDLETLGFLFESLVTRDIRIYASALDAFVYHYRERAGELEADLIVEARNGDWVGIEVKLGGSAIDQAAASLRRLSDTRVMRPPAALAVITTTPYAYRRDDGVWVIPLALLGP